MEDLSFWQVLDAMASAHGNREYLVSPHVRRTYAEVRDRALNLAGNLAAHGCGCQRERDVLQPFESGQDHVGLLSGNRPEYIEAMFGALRARCAPVNLNYRYVASELNQVMRTARVTALFYERDLADTVRAAIADLPPMKMLVEIGGDGTPAIDGAIAYEQAALPSNVVPPDPRPEDLCVACTGGTTGLPKAVLWRQCDLFAGMAGDTHTVTQQPIATLDDLVRFANEVNLKSLVCQPLMHFAGFGNSVLLASAGATMCIPEPGKGFDPSKALSMVEAERVARLGMVGDAFARPLIAELKRHQYDLSSLRVVSSGGAALTPGVKAELARVLGSAVAIREGMGSSEGGLQGGNSWTGNDEAGVFDPAPRMRLLSADRSRELGRDEREHGWLSTVDRVPLGYLNEPGRTAETFPVIDGRRYSIPGDRAQWRDDGKIKLLGRDSLTINTGGEKVFSEEVEEVIRRDPRVDDVLVVGRASERWGQEVVALIVPNGGAAIDRESINREAAGSLARYKLPKEVFIVPAIERTAAGKPDYSWARALVTDATSSESPS